LENVLNAVRAIDSELRRVITVFGCGGDRDKKKRPLMGEIAARLSNIVIVTSDNPRTEAPDAIIADIMEGIPKERSATTEVSVDRKQAIQHALSLASKDDVVVIAGKGHENYQIVGNDKIHFDDKEIVVEWITKNV
ncbi:MAG TPA: cyanophycin synthetase, partial [Saprospiraceae bacterium]|nr:cyanophycin synthetase [Saprospiraceae bacterium]